MLSYLTQALALGFAAGAQPGAFQVFLVSRAAGSGWRRALPAVLAPLLSDGPAILLSTLLLATLPRSLMRFLYAAGGLFLLWLARGAFLAWRRGGSAARGGKGADAAGADGAAGLLRAAAMNFLNPAPFMYWSLVSGPILLGAWAESALCGAAFLAAFYAALISINVAIVLVFGLAASRGETLRRTFQALSALAMCAFGLYQLARAFLG